MMPLLRARELVEFFEELTDGYNSFETYEQKIATEKAKQCATKSVLLVLYSNPRYPNDTNLDEWNEGFNQYDIERQIQARDYWQMVLHEIKNL